jgi:hypothetical protein
MKPQHLIGRPPKNATGQFPYSCYSWSWQVRPVVKYIQDGLAIMRCYGDASPEFDEAARQVGRCLLESCDPGNPAKFLHKVGSEFEGELMHSPADEKYYHAWQWCVAGNIIHGLKRWPTFPEWKERLRKRNSSLAADSSLRRSMKRLGLPLALVEEAKVPKLT